jgi:hypothetical protein
MGNLPLVPELNLEVLGQLRQFATTGVEPLLEGRAVDRREVTVASLRQRADPAFDRQPGAERSTPAPRVTGSTAVGWSWEIVSRRSTSRGSGSTCSAGCGLRRLPAGARGLRHDACRRLLSGSTVDHQVGRRHGYRPARVVVAGASARGASGQAELHIWAGGFHGLAQRRLAGSAHP